MSSVTRLHLLSQSMLNVRCQKQKRCGSFPADSLPESPMEIVGQRSPSGACDLLEVPAFGALDAADDEGEVVVGIRPKSSPLPRRKSSVSDDDSEPEPSTCGSRRVSFADAKGLSLVQVKEFETWDVPNLQRCDFSEGEAKDTEDYFLSLLNFSLPLSDEELCFKVRDQKVVLETIELLPETTILKGVVRVLNVSFTKAVYIRTTLDTWSSHFDVLAEYSSGSSDGQMDCFSFKLTLVPPFGEQGTRVEFCLRYETPVGTFWANNDRGNYVLLCHRGIKGHTEKPQRENLNKKSCLKPVSPTPPVENASAAAASPHKHISTDGSKRGEDGKTVNDQQTSADHSGTSEDDEQKLRAENRRSSSGGGHRKAARAAPPRGCRRRPEDEDDDAPDNAGALQVPKPVSADTEAHPHTGNLFTGASEPRVHPQGAAQEASVTLQTQAEARLSETDPRATRANACEGPDQRNADNELGQTVTISTPDAASREDKLLEALRDFSPNHADTSVAKETANSSVRCCEIVDKNDFATRETSLEAPKETSDAEERNKLSCSCDDEAITEVASEVAEPVTKADRTQGDMFVQFKDEAIIVAETIKHRGTEAAVSAQEELTPAEPSKGKSSKVTGMVKEKDRSASTQEEEREAIGSKAEATETAEKNSVGIETANKTAKERGKPETDEKLAEKDADVLEEDEIRNIVGRKKTDFEKEGEHAQATRIETVTGGDKRAEGGEVEKRETELSEVGTGRTSDQKEKKTETESEMKTDEVELGDEVKPRQEDRNAERKEEKPVDGESAVGCSEGQWLQSGDSESESDSDDEVELYMRCLRAAHAGTRAGQRRRAACAVVKRPPGSKGKNVSAHMPSISEALDEEQHLGCRRGQDGDGEKSRVRPAATALAAGRENVGGQVSWWKGTFSCGNSTKTLLYATSLVVFLVVAYHYDFLACFALYLASVVWLCFQGETRPAKNKRIG